MHPPTHTRKRILYDTPSSSKRGVEPRASVVPDRRRETALMDTGGGRVPDEQTPTPQGTSRRWDQGWPTRSSPSTIAPTDTKARSRNSIRALCICSLHHSDSLGLASLRTLRRVLDSWLPITLPDRLTLLVVEARIEGTAQSMATKEGGDRTEKASNRRRQPEPEPEPEPERSRRKTTEEQKTKTENRKTSKTRKGKRTADGW
jgi:hypothetical protein